MADYLASGNKTIMCKHCGYICEVSLQTTLTKCDHCGMTLYVNFFGTVIDKNGNYVY